MSDKQNEELPIEIASGVFWVGSPQQDRNLQCHPYLIHRGGNAVLIDPGSVLDCRSVRKKVESIVSLNRIDYIILHHQDPDLCSAVPYFESKGFTGKIATHRKTAELTLFYGIKSPYFLIDENNFNLSVGREINLHFIPAPYLHFPGAFMTYDDHEALLFSGDLFGAISYDGPQDFWADENYAERMEHFHENYMPSNSILRPVMEGLLKIPIETIAPQHGSIISGRESVLRHIRKLRDLECGTFLIPTMEEQIASDNYRGLCDQILKRLFSLYPSEEIFGIFAPTGISLNRQSGTIEECRSTGKSLWDDLFQYIYTAKGESWLTSVESLVFKISEQLSIGLPAIYESILYKRNIEIKALGEEMESMKGQLLEVRHQLLHCPITNLFNQRFFVQYLDNQIGLPEISFSIAFLGIDGLAHINSRFGESAGDDTLKAAGYIIMNFQNSSPLRKGYLTVKLNAPVFALFMPMLSAEEADKEIRELFSIWESSDLFLEPVTLSAGIVFSDTGNSMSLIEEGVKRVSFARKTEGNSICDFPIADQFDPFRKTILLIEPDELVTHIIGERLEKSGYRLLLSTDGSDGLDKIERENPDLIISELNLPQIGGLEIKKTISHSADLSIIPFILISGQKTEKAIIQASRLNILHFLQKPFSIEELSGLVRNLL